MKEIQILKDLPYDIWYSYKNKTIYIYPPVKVKDLDYLRHCFTYYDIEIKNIVIGRIYENYL